MEPDESTKRVAPMFDGVSDLFRPGTDPKKPRKFECTDNAAPAVTKENMYVYTGRNKVGKFALHKQTKHMTKKEGGEPQKKSDFNFHHVPEGAGHNRLPHHLKQAFFKPSFMQDPWAFLSNAAPQQNQFQNQQMSYGQYQTMTVQRPLHEPKLMPLVGGNMVQSHMGDFASSKYGGRGRGRGRRGRGGRGNYHNNQQNNPHMHSYGCGMQHTGQPQLQAPHGKTRDFAPPMMGMGNANPMALPSPSQVPNVTMQPSAPPSVMMAPRSVSLQLPRPKNTQEENTPFEFGRSKMASDISLDDV